MTKLISLSSKQQITQALGTALSIIQDMPVIKECRSCEHWNTDGCRLAGGKMPPRDVLLSGCEVWIEADVIPY